MLKFVVACLLPALLAAPAAEAGPILGSFSSKVASGNFQTPGGSVNVTGTTVTGTFALGSVAGATTPAGLPTGVYLLQPGAVTLTFDIQAINQIVDFPIGEPSEASSIELTDSGTIQTLLLEPVFFDPHEFTTEELTGPEGSLFTNIDDPGSIHIGRGVSLVSPIFLSVYQEGSATLDVASEQLGPSSVPEPTGWAVLALPVLGLVTLRGVRLRRIRPSRIASLRGRVPS